MIRLSKLTDYGFVVLSRVSAHGSEATVNARDLAAETNLPMPTVSKLLKILARHGLLVAHRGVKGGYSLSRPPAAISASEIITALEGPIAFTDCTAPEWDGDCCLESSCPTRGHWQRITAAVQTALGHVTLAELAQPFARAGQEVRLEAAKTASQLVRVAGSGCTSGGCGGNSATACTCGHDLEPHKGTLK